ncbi:hypothetical protein FB446DRAFT_795006 [Lentinula raphanica]|nr:hypothetical protein FB446DRAFT_795006 [Lentinula raphanica]
MLGLWDVTHRTRGNDTRIFDTKRVGVFAGYDTLPIVDDRLSFTFPEGCRKSARIVSYEDQEDEMFSPELRIELWSPNSFKYPFFPGVRPVELPSHNPYNRIDGHFGRFDPSRNPQYFDPRRPYLPFIRRSDKGIMTSQEVECVPLYAVWESSAYPSRDKGYIQELYWNRIVERAKCLRRRMREIGERGHRYAFPGFLEAQPSTSSVERDPRLPGRISFEEMVTFMSDVQFELKAMAAWVRMAEALDRWNWNSDHSHMLNDHSTRVEDSLVGLWVNGMSEFMVGWFLLASVPLYVCHAVRGSQDWPDTSPYSIWVKNGLDSSELQKSTVIEMWQSLYRNEEASNPRDSSIESGEWMKPSDKLESWRSSSRATKTNFPGEAWGSQTEAPAIIEDDHLLPPRPEIAPLIPGYDPYFKPPPVQAANLKLRIRHYIEDFDDNFERCFKYTSQEDIYSSFIYTYVDRTNRRYLHTDSRLYIEPGVVHPVDVYGLPGPRMKFYDDFECQVRTSSPYWVYEQELPSPEDVGRIAPVPSVERLHLTNSLSVETDDETHKSPLQIPVDYEVVANPETHCASLPLDTSEVMGEGSDAEKECPPGEELGTIEFSVPPLNNPSMVDSVIPGEERVCIWDVSPFVMITGIGQVEIAEFREWLQSKAPSLKLMAVARALERKYIQGYLVRKRKVLYVKFWDRSHAASFWYAFQDAELMEKDMRIHGMTMKEFKVLKKKDLLDYWDVELAGKLNPLINRIKEPLIDRLSDYPYETKRIRLEFKTSIKQGLEKRISGNKEGGRIMSKNALVEDRSLSPPIVWLTII